MEKSSKGINQDRKKVAGTQEHEVAYEKGKMNSTGKEVKAAIKKVGNSRSKVESALKEKNK